MNLLHFLGTGYGHAAKGQGCQDRIRTETLSNGTTVIAVSDGCSSSKCAEVAAQSNVDVICNIFSRFSIDSLSFDAFIQLYPELKNHAESYGGDLAECFAYALQKPLYTLARKGVTETNDYVDISDFCATLLFAVCEKNKMLIGHIGDGNVICFDNKSNVVYRSEEDNGEDAYHTYFTVDSNFTQHFHYDIIPSDNIACVVMFSDGPQNMFKCEGGNIEAGVSEIIAKPVLGGKIRTDKELEKVLTKYIAHAKHYVFDDWSLVVAYKGKKVVREISPVSLDEIFMEEFKKIKFDDFGNIISVEQDSDNDAQDIDYTMDLSDDNSLCDEPKTKIYCLKAEEKKEDVCTEDASEYASSESQTQKTGSKKHKKSRFKPDLSFFSSNEDRIIVDVYETADEESGAVNKITDEDITSDKKKTKKKDNSKSFFSCKWTSTEKKPDKNKRKKDTK